MNCIKDNHLKKTKIYCKTCNFLICLNCLDEHTSKQHNCVGYEKVFNDLISNKQNIEENLIRIESQKRKLEIDFISSVNDEFIIQSELIKQEFKQLHDELHVKEIALTRELTSYFGDNSELYTSEISKLDQELTLTKLNIENKSISSQSSQQDKIEYINNYISSSNPNKNNSNSNTNNNAKLPYHKCEIPKTNLKSIYDSIIHLELTKDKKLTSPSTNTTTTSSIVVNNNNNNNYKLVGSDEMMGYQYMYVYSKNNQNLKVDLKSGAEIVLEKGEKVPQLVFFQYNNRSRYLFDSCRFWNFNDGNGMVKISMELSPTSCYSSIYDGKDYIYIIGGMTSNNIIRFHIATETFLKVGQLPANLYYTSVSYDELSKDLYMIGGSNTVSGYSSSIYRFNTQTCTIQIITRDMFGIKNNSTCFSGCYIGNNQKSFYILTDTHFTRVTEYVNQNQQLPTPKSISSKYKHIEYDGFDHIICIGVDRKDIEIFNIKTNQWLTLSYHTKHPITIDDSILFSNN